MEGSSSEGRHQKSRYTLREHLSFTLKITKFQDVVHHLIRRQVRQHPQAPNFWWLKAYALLDFQFFVQSNKNTENANIW